MRSMRPCILGDTLNHATLMRLYETDKPAFLKEVARMHPRHAELHAIQFDTPKGYLNHDHFLDLSLAGDTTYQMMGDDARLHEADTLHMHSAHACMKLMPSPPPSYWLGRTIGEMLMATQTPEGMTWMDVPWPMPTWNLMLPEGLIVDGDGRSVVGISVTLCDLVKDTDAQVIAGDTRLYAVAYTLRENGEPIAWYIRDHTNHTPSAMEERNEYRESTLYGGGSASNKVADKEMTWALGHLVANVAFYLAQEQAQLEEPKTLRKAKQKKGRFIRELASPRWVAKGMHGPRSESVGTHSSPRVHWRRGHWKGVRYGEGRKLLKRVWIQPTLVNA
jgi:hypothetical protein